MGTVGNTAHIKESLLRYLKADRHTAGPSPTMPFVFLDEHPIIDDGYFWFPDQKRLWKYARHYHNWLRILIRGWSRGIKRIDSDTTLQKSSSSQRRLTFRGYRAHLGPGQQNTTCRPDSLYSCAGMPVLFSLELVRE